MVNTSSGNGGIAPPAGTPIYALTKAGVVTVTECLYAQLQTATGGRLGASVLFPGPHMLRTGLFSSWRNRPAELASASARQASIEAFEKRLADAGAQVTYTPVEQVADRVVDAISDGTFWILPRGGRADEQIETRAASMLARANPTYITDPYGFRPGAAK